MENARGAMGNPLVQHIYKVNGLENEADAEKWLLKNHPEEAISFIYSTTTGNFNLQPSIDFVSRDNYLGTREERESYIKDRAKEYGIEIGTFDYREADKALAGKNYVVAYERNGMGHVITHGYDSLKEAAEWAQEKVQNGQAAHLNADLFVFRAGPEFNPAKPIPMSDIKKLQEIPQKIWTPPIPKQKDVKPIKKDFGLDR